MGSIMDLDESKIIELKNLIKKSKKIVFFGGDGVSTESGILDFRSKDGLYNLKSKYGKPYEVMLSHSYYEENTKTFFEFYKEFMITSAQPNEAHKYLAKLEKSKDLTIITQNIDGLHQAAGSKNVIELHGSIKRNYCTKCGAFYDDNYIKNSKGIPLCNKCKGIIKPDVTLYEEPVNEYAFLKARFAIEQADLLIIAGTSLNVYPANSLIYYFYGDNIVLINNDDQIINRKIKMFIKGKVGEIFKKLY